jgi:hypothetical protein
VYFLHIPKTAGVSTALALKGLSDRSGRSMVGPCIADQLLAPGIANWKDADILIGHLGAWPIKHAGRSSYVTIVRDPVPHAVSWYRHVARDPNHYFHRIVADEGISFSDWFDDPRFFALTDNPQARHLGLCPDLDRAEYRADDPTFNQRSFELSERIESDGELYVAAQTTLDGAAVVGTVDRFDEFISGLARVLGVSDPTFPRTNVDPAPLRIDAGMRRRILDRCAIDADLYRRVESHRVAA